MSDVDKIDEGTGGLGSLSRRDFIFREGAALGAVALGSTAFGLTGCAPEVTSDPEQSSGDAGSTAVEEELPGAQPIPPEEPPATWDKEADFVVVGTGGGGLAASSYCADQGHSVITVEKLATPGGSTQHSSVFVCLGGTRYQEAVKFAYPSYPFDPEEYIQSVWRISQHTADLPLLRQVVNKAPQCIDWMGDMGVKWGFDPQFGPIAFCWEGACDGDFYPLATKYVTDYMYEVGVDKGVDFMFETSCDTLIKDGDRIVGIKATNLEGETTYIHAKNAVLLTAGGFAVNRDMLKKYIPTAYEGSASAYIMPCDTGECTRMGVGAGADISGFDSWCSYSGGLDDFAEGTGTFQHYLYSGDNQLSRQPWLLVDIMGQRYPFLDSSADNNNDPIALNAQAAVEVSRKDHRGYVIFDSDYETNIFKFGQSGCRRPLQPTMTNIDRLPESFAPHDWREGVKSALERGIIKQGDTVEELAEQLGFDPPVLAKAVSDWNEVVASGEDTEFGWKPEWLVPCSKPPFYGIKVGGQISGSLAGLRVTPNMQVINTEGEVIPGLYAGFFTAGGSMGESSYSAGATPGGVIGSNGLSWTSGYIAAEAAVAEMA